MTMWSDVNINFDVNVYENGGVNVIVNVNRNVNVDVGWYCSG